MAPLRIGLAGVGFAGLRHLKAFSVRPDCEVVALAGVEGETVGSVAAEYGVRETHIRWEDLVARDDLDVVCLALPNALHAPAATAALRAGKHVLCEKPMARTATEAEAMVAAATEADRVLHVVFNRRYHPEVGIVREAVAAGRLGTVYHARAWWMRRAGIPGRNTWYTSREQAGGGPLADLGTHALDMALVMLGEPDVVSVSAAAYDQLGRQGVGVIDSAALASDHDGFEVEDFATAFVRLAGGATLQLEAAWATHSQYYNEYGVQLFGSAAGALVRVDTRVPGSALRLFSAGGDQESSSGRVDGHAGAVGDFVAAIHSGQWDGHRGTAALARVRVIDAAYRSAEAGREVPITPTGPVPGQPVIR
uniref:Gfo/Idh/MocA family protein n=1 Tax=Microbispora cellulosiformans TaxID=2614688 RepID=UPI001786137E|nr:Gfo/Idh/MocA family oxidoreductase [Microbispora cellulosiformans]